MVALWRRTVSGLRSLIHRSAEDRDLADEVRHYYEQVKAEHLARGLTGLEARRAADREFGREWDVAEEVRGYGWENRVESVLADLRYAARRLRAAPGTTAIVVLTLALGIGATSAIMGAVNAILLKPLRYPDAGRVVTVWDRSVDDGRLDLTFGNYRELVSRSRTLASMAVMKPWQPALSGGEEPERLAAQQVSAGYFRTLGVAPARGRDFMESEDRAGGPSVVILSDGLFRRRFGGDPSIIGRSILLDDDPYTVIGVMPADFENVLSPPAEAWAPLRYEMSEDRAWGHHLRAVARVRPGVRPREAAQELNAIAASPVAEFARPDWAMMPEGVLVRALQDDVTRGVRPALLAILCAVVVVLAITCVNVTNLLLSRATRRRGELALRSVLGAGSHRLTRQLLTESLLISAIAGALGLVMAGLGIEMIRGLSPVGLPRVDAIRLDGTMLSIGLLVTTLAGLGSGLFPALHAARQDPAKLLQHASPRTTGRRTTRSALVIAEVALALVLLVGAGLLLRSLGRLLAVDAGIDAGHLLSMQLQVSSHRFDDDRAARRFFDAVLDAVRNVPGVEAAALTNMLPLSGDDEMYGLFFEPTREEDPGQMQGGTFRYAVSPGYAETMGMPLRSGRLLDARDDAESPPVAMISESLARHRLPGADPIGIRIRIGSSPTTYTIVGVVGDVKQLSLALNGAEAVYTTSAQWTPAERTMSLVVRTRGEPTVLVPAVRQAIRGIDRDQPISRIATMDALLAASSAERRFVLALFEAFAVAALLLAAAGIYGVLAGAVAERSREIGVRSALGASRSRILGLVAGQGFLLAGAGIAIGMVAAAAVSRAMTSLLFGVTRLDPITYAAVTALMATVALAACAVPALRAVRVDPATTLQSE